MPVEVILKTKIEGLGSEADIVSVKPGYARNFLIPKDFAAPATSATKRQMEDLKRKRAEREAAELNEAQELAGKLGKLKLVFVLESGEGQEKSFGAVTNLDIATQAQGSRLRSRPEEDRSPQADQGHGRARSDAQARSDIVATLHVTVNHPTPKEAPEGAEATDAKGGKKPAKARKA